MSGDPPSGASRWEEYQTYSSKVFDLPEHCPQQIQRLVQQRLEALQRAGVSQLLAPPRQVQQPATVPSQDLDQHAASPITEEPVPPSRRLDPAPDGPRASDLEGVNLLEQTPLSLDERNASLRQAARDVAACTLCRELAETRTQTVFGVGDPQARLVFLGEAPGADEDRQGEPFVGRAGQLLTKIIEACSLTRDSVYILNILKCRPPGNRNPSRAEAANCQQFLLRQLRVIQPEFICCLGTVAAQNLLDTQTTIGKLRGRFHDYHGIRVLATYHPAYLLRNPDAKRHTWDDMKILMKAMGIKIKT